jgi:hypothetical protein
VEIDGTNGNGMFIVTLENDTRFIVIDDNLAGVERGKKPRTRRMETEPFHPTGLELEFHEHVGGCSEIMKGKRSDQSTMYQCVCFFQVTYRKSPFLLLEMDRFLLFSNAFKS